jgi:uncharacterized SAM-binding protein YcdF (DUF218 family)
LDLQGIVQFALLPPGGPLLATMAGLVLSLRWRWLGFAVAAGSTLLLYLMATPFLAGMLSNVAGGGRAVEAGQARQAQAIVVLAGGLSGDATEEYGVTLGPLTLERVRYGVKLARQVQLPVAVTGGTGRAGLTEAGLMRAAMVDEYGLAPRWVEAESGNTQESAQLTAQMLRAEGVHTVLMVTHPFDVRRARRQFEANGLKVIPAPAQVPPAGDASIWDFLPSVWAMLVSHYSTYELLGLLRDRLME